MAFKIYSSSAGSGKTYTLTKEYLKIVLGQENPNYFRHILAITFTNDAANEMKARILKMLKHFAFPENLSEKELKNRDQLLDAIAEEIEQSKNILTQRAEKIFVKIIYNYSDFSVSTIDSFVNNVISAFTRELDLPHNYEILMDSKLIRQSVDALLEDIGKSGKELFSQIVLDWVLERVKNNQSWTRVAQDLTSFVQRDVSNERAYAYINSLKNITLEEFQSLTQELNEYISKTEKKLKDLGGQALEVIDKGGVSLDEFKSKSRGVGHYFRRINENSFSGGLLKDFFKAAQRKVVFQALEGDWYTGKTANHQIDAISLELTDILSEIEQIRETEKVKYEMAVLVKKNLYKIALVQEIEKEFNRLKKESQALHISDTNKKIAQVVANEPVPFIYERVGQYYKHMLIDEFQDTSVLQWLNLLPLVENNLAEARFNLIVGDAKQAIYRWRGGEMEQLVKLYKNQVNEMDTGEKYEFPFLAERYALLAQHQDPKRLNYNYRSTKEVVQFNNQFFRAMVDVLGGIYPLLRDIYDEAFEQESPSSAKTGGHVEIQFVERPKGAKEVYQEESILKVQEYVNQATEAGFSYKDIAIIFRQNIHGRYLAQHFEKQGIPIVSRDSLLLSSDEKVGFIISLLQLLAFPKDRLHKSEVLYLFYKVVKKEIPNESTHKQIKELLERPILDLFNHIKEQGFKLEYADLQQLALYELVEKFIEVFKLLENQPGLEYLFRFLDLVLEFSQQTGSSLADFLETWKEKKDDLSISLPEGIDAITLTTIHRSKGLEFPVVIVPFVDWKLDLDGKKDKIWVDLPDDFYQNFEQKAVKTTLLPATQDLRTTPFAEHYHYEAERKFIENLNLLYVAFTRPVNRLYIISQLTTKQDAKNAQELIVKYLVYHHKVEQIPTNFVVFEGKEKNKKNQETDKEEMFFQVKELVSTDVHRKFKTPHVEKI